MASYWQPRHCVEVTNFSADPKYEEEVSGCTASVGLISSTKIFVVSRVHRRTLDCTAPDLEQANAGDSRSVLGVKGRAKPLSFDHKPQNEGNYRFYVNRNW